jgi:hypothetical protein
VNFGIDIDKEAFVLPKIYGLELELKIALFCLLSENIYSGYTNADHRMFVMKIRDEQLYLKLRKNHF